MMAEVCNEVDDVPATLGDVLNSVRNGFDPDPEEEFDVKKVENQLLELVKEYGLQSEVGDFLSKSDWDRRFEVADRRERIKRQMEKLKAG
jgi:hypothetical protein